MSNKKKYTVIYDTESTLSVIGITEYNNVLDDKNGAFIIAMVNEFIKDIGDNINQINNTNQAKQFINTLNNKIKDLSTYINGKIDNTATKNNIFTGNLTDIKEYLDNKGIDYTGFPILIEAFKLNNDGKLEPNKGI